MYKRVLPDGFNHVLTDDERLKLFSKEHKPAIDHLLKCTNDSTIDVLYKIDDLFKDCCLSIYSDQYTNKQNVNNDGYLGQWHNFFFSVVDCVFSYSTSKLARQGNQEKAVPLILEWKGVKKDITDLVEEAKEKAQELEELICELHNKTNPPNIENKAIDPHGFISCFPNQEKCLSHLDEIHKSLKEYSPTQGFYMHYQEPIRIGKFKVFLNAFFKIVEASCRIGVTTPALLSINDREWSCLLNYALDLKTNPLTQKNINDFTKNLTY